MTPSDDVPGEMHRRDHHDDLNDRVLDGRLHADDAPGEVRFAADLVDALRAPARPDELADGDRVVAMVAAAVHADASPETPAPRRKSMFGHALVAKLAIGAAALLGVTAAGAAAGALPDAAQSTIAGALSHVGVSVPDPDHHDVTTEPNETDTTDPTTTTTTAGATTQHEADQPGEDHGTGPGEQATAGLCQAFGSGQGGVQGGKLDSTAFRTLEDEAHAAGTSVDQFCANETHGKDGHSDNGHDGQGSGTPTTGQSGEDHGGDHHGVNAGPPATNPSSDHHGDSHTTPTTADQQGTNSGSGGGDQGGHGHGGD